MSQNIHVTLSFSVRYCSDEYCGLYGNIRAIGVQFMWHVELHGIAKSVVDCLIVPTDADPRSFQGQACRRLYVVGRDLLLDLNVMLVYLWHELEPVPINGCNPGDNDCALLAVGAVSWMHSCSHAADAPVRWG